VEEITVLVPLFRIRIFQDRKILLVIRDMIKAMSDGKTYADGKLIYSEGKFHGI
jgi:hypothetical protein